MFKHILVPLDGSTLAEAALPVAASLAKTLGADVTLVHVIEKNAPRAVHGEHHLTDPDEASAYLNQLAGQVFPPGTHVNSHVHTAEVSNVARSIVDHVGEFAPDLIVMCSHGSGGLRDILVGNIAQQVIAQRKTPVLLIHPESDVPAPFQCRQILVPMDGKPAHEHGLRIAAGLGSAYHATLTLLFVVPTRGTLGGHQAATGMLLPGTMTALLDINEQAARDYLTAQAQKISPSDLQVDQVVIRGDPVPAITDFAERLPIDLIVLGTHGKSGAGAFWAGSVAPKLAGICNIPLLFVPVKAPKSEG